MAFEQTINPTATPLTSVGYVPPTGIYGPQVVPQSLFGNLLGQPFPVLPFATAPNLLPQITAPQILSQINPLVSSLLGQPTPLLPFGTPPQSPLQSMLTTPFSQPGSQPYLTGLPFGLPALSGNIFNPLAHMLPYPLSQQLLAQSVMGSPFNPYGLLSPIGIPQWAPPALGNIWQQLAQQSYLPFHAGFRPIY